jgi:HlyD family secretion protein
VFRSSRFIGFLFLSSFILSSWTLQSEEPKTKDKVVVTPKVSSIKVETGPLVQTVKLKGTIEAEKSTELVLRLKAWVGPLQIKKVMEHGSVVKAGDVVLEFDTEKVQQALRESKQDREIAELTLKIAELDLPLTEKLTELELAIAEREGKQAVEDLKQYLEVDKVISIAQAQRQLKSSAFNLETAKDELKQLSKMYKDKDLTEETEEIVLKRYKNGLEQAEFFYKLAQNSTKQALNVQIPRREQVAKDTALKTEIATTRIKSTTPITLKQKQLSLAKQKVENVKAQKRLEELEADLAAMKVTAPVDGMLYHGRNLRGNWVQPTGQPIALTPSGFISNNEIFMTVVDTSELSLRSDVGEDDFASLSVGLEGKFVPTAFLEERVASKITKLGVAPINGRFEVRASLSNSTSKIVPGMTGSLKFITANKPKALTLLKSAIFEDEMDGSKYVYKIGKDGMTKKTAIKVGLTVGEKSEILSGLDARDEVSPTKPTEEK